MNTPSQAHHRHQETQLTYVPIGHACKNLITRRGRAFRQAATRVRQGGTPCANRTALAIQRIQSIRPSLLFLFGPLRHTEDLFQRSVTEHGLLKAVLVKGFHPFVDRRLADFHGIRFAESKLANP